MDTLPERDKDSRNISSREDLAKTVLLVEDDRTHRVLMDKILTECGFQTVQAENGIVALSKIDSGQVFDLVLMDWDMPKLDGLETVREIRASEVKEGKPHMPVIAFTANRSPGDREECLAAGMDAYLSKDVWMPKWRQTLIDNLQGVVAGRFDLVDCENLHSSPACGHSFDLEAFDLEALEHSAMLLKDELSVAVEEYLEDAAAYIRDIGDGLVNRDAEKAARCSHPLKSNSKGFGLDAVSEIAEAINVLARSGDLDSVATLLPRLQDAFRRGESTLRAAIKAAGY